GGWDPGRLSALQNVTQLISHSFTSQFVFPVLGHTEPPSDLYQQLIALWQHWLPTEALTTFQKGGYYMIEQKARKLRVIALNTNLWAVENDVEDPGGQWQWLDSQLAKLYRNRQTVYLVGHIAPGFDERQGSPPRLGLAPRHNARYVQMISKYSEVIMGQFFSHLHSDTFRIVYTHTGVPVSSIFLAPAVTPQRTVSGTNNPGLRLYKFDTDTGQLLDYSQYYLDLTAANQKGEADWSLEYNFTSYYQLSEVSPKALHDLAQMFTTEEGKEVFGRYWVANSVQVYNLPTNLAWVNAHYCAITQLDFTGYHNCLMTRASALAAASSGQDAITSAAFLVLTTAIIFLVLR
ncbi:hypothetical protein AAG570_004087, partial [Ranatra chinensis]